MKKLLLRTYQEELQEEKDIKKIVSFIKFVLINLALIALIFSCSRLSYASELKASWYSVESLKKEGTWKYSKGVMANGKMFKDEEKTCATRLYKIGTNLRITNVRNKKTVVVKVTDRIGKRFATKRIDLSKKAFSQIAKLKQGLIQVIVERI